jgi:hypothetical protein
VPAHSVQPHPAAPSGLHDRLILTYANKAQTDGVGAQLQRIYGIYSISRLLGASYLHTPLACVDYQGLAALERNVADPGFHHEFNDLFQIRSDVLPADSIRTMHLPYVSMEIFHQLVAMVDRRDSGRSYLVQLVTPYGIADRFPDCYEVCKEISPFEAYLRDGDTLRVAIHVRRGELLVLDSDRMLPNSYYINVAQQVARVLDALKLDYRIELCTEVPNHDILVQSDHHGISNRINAPVVVSPDMCRLDEFSVLPNLVHCVNERTIDCIRRLATADIVVMSRSSFSYLAGILNRDGIVLYHPFWHSPLSSWMTVAPDGAFDQPQLRSAVRARQAQQAR